MTIKNAFENVLVELNKVQAPAMLLDDFIYLFNKGVQLYVNERYNLFETKQQLTDDLRVLVKTVSIIPSLQVTGGIFGKSYKCDLPSDYVHILNCICEFKDKSPKCDDDEVLHFGANKLNTNQWPHIVNNFYLKPSVRNPYYYIVNIDDPVSNATGKTSDEDKKKAATTTGNLRYGNSVTPVMQIKYGDSKKYTLEKVYVDYLRAPIYYALTQDDLDSIADNTQVIEFPDYVVYEIINKVVALTLENNGNPRMQTQPIFNKTIV